jgi:hypothetical protein
MSAPFVALACLSTWLLASLPLGMLVGRWLSRLDRVYPKVAR